jgi:imidazolonepropionase-like amidohydrolase
LLLIFALVLCLSVVAAAQTVAFVGVNVIPMDKERVLRDQTVIIKDGLIEKIGDGENKNSERCVADRRERKISDSGAD